MKNITFNTCAGHADGETEAELSEIYGRKVSELEKKGIWNTEIANALPLAAANRLGKLFTLYRSRLQCPALQRICHTRDLLAVL